MNNDPIIHQAVSLCPTCYKTIPANLRESNGRVYLDKGCSEHGEAPVSLVEPDVEFWRMLQALSRRSESIYNHLVMDVTSRCNMACPQCYYPVNNHAPQGDLSIESLVQEALTTNLDLVLGGAEPTCRKDLPELVQALAQIRPVSMITNGIALADEELVHCLVDAGLVKSAMGFNTFEAAISLHTPEYVGQKLYAKKLLAIDNIHSLGLRIGELMFTIERLDQMEGVLRTIQQHASYTNRFRIRGPHGNWATRPGVGSVALSDMHNRLRALAVQDGVPFHIEEDGWDNNLYHLVVNYDGISIRLIHCPEVANVILNELLGYGPFGRAHNGELTNFVHSLMINEGMAKGWLHGRRIQ